MEPIIRSAVVHHIFFLSVLFLSILNIKFSVGTTVVGCNERERKALLTFKRHLKDPSNVLSSWDDSVGNDKDCCTWNGVSCNNKSTDDHQNVNVFVHELHLEDMYLRGPLPDQLGRLKNLEYLSLKMNSFSGSIPPSLGRLSLLKKLDLSHNKLTGSLPRSIGQLSNLKYLNIHNNSMEGIVTEAHFANLSRLETLGMNSMVFKLSQDWVPPFQLRDVILPTCSLGPQFPKWLLTQKHMRIIDLSSTGISGAVPAQFWNFTSGLVYLDLSQNQLNGELPKLLEIEDTNDGMSRDIDLSSNRFEGQLPRISSSITKLDLSNNSISGPISVLLCNPLNEGNALELLDLSGNLLSGELPKCWIYWKHLKFLSLGSNNITGKIPSSIGSLFRLQSLHLRNNSFFGELPSSFRNFSFLQVVDLGENAFTGSISTWMGETHPYLISLSLRLNKFYGGIPREICHLSSLQLLDLAYNNLSGSIPRCFSNFTAMASKQDSVIIGYNRTFGSGGYSIWLEKEFLVTKGRQIEYRDNLFKLAKSVDLSHNSLSGEIPEELTSLFELQSLNLSENYFTGKIPKKIGAMRSLESLDLSRNILSGSIPQSMKDLTFLGHLNLSYNNLSGKIPSSTQLQSFTALSYMAGKQGLCGPPLKNCNGNEKYQSPDHDERATKEDEVEEWLEKNSFYISLTLGSIIGFWGFWGVLVVKKAWRFAYFRFLDNIMNKLCKC